MARMMSACGVMCSVCPAFHGEAKGAAHQAKTAEAWLRIYGLNEPSQNISCDGFLGPDNKLFHTSIHCKARRCCLSKGFHSCAECNVIGCLYLEKAQSVWDEVPEISKNLSRRDFVIYARPYCNHRRRLANARQKVQITR